jgi:hypothetical protein
MITGTTPSIQKVQPFFHAATSEIVFLGLLAKSAAFLKPSQQKITAR